MTEPQTQSPDERAEMYLKLRDRGLSYKEVAEACNAASEEAVRSVIRRYNHKHFGTYTGTPPEGAQRHLSAEPVPKIVGTPEVKTKAEIWTIDIERRPRIVYEWQASRKYSSFTPESMVLEESRMISFAAKKLGEGSVFFSSEFHHGRESMLTSLYHILDSASIVVSYNGSRFDIPHINGELRDSGFPVYSPLKQIDLLQTVKRKFKYDHNRLDEVLRRWGITEQKMDAGGFDLWKRCMANDPEAWAEMREYNKQDVRSTEAAYLANLQWLAGSIPNLGLWAGEDQSFCCPACGSGEVKPEGVASTGVSLFQAYLCSKCGYRSRSNEKVGSTTLRPVTW